MKDAFRKILTEAVRQACAQPPPSLEAANHLVKPDPKPPPARLGVDPVSTAIGVYLIRWGDNPGKLQELLGTSLGETQQTTFPWFLSKLNQNEHTGYLYYLTSIGGHVKLSFHFKTGSDINLMGSDLFEEVNRAMLSLIKLFQAEACDVSITSWVEMDITLKDMTLVHPFYMCTLNTELFLGGQDLLDRLAPLSDCHQDQLCVQAEVQKPLGASSEVSLVTNQVASLEEPKEPFRPSSVPVMGTSVTQLHPATQKTPPRCSHASFLHSLKNPGVKPHNPKVVKDVHLESMFIP
ncbi:hypothetical protein AMECASPLE_021097 [Ameca splendens]|uniref:Uncharacterized protein n=1 Tax=Ameca splendens TaxID=208324 RepID=A0ABV0YF42_9TELE